MLVTRDAGLAARSRHLRSHAKLPGADYVHDDVGFNYRMSSLQAALGLSQLRRIETLIARRCEIGMRYRALFTPDGPFSPQPIAGWATLVPSFFAVVASTAGLRERARERLAQERIECRPLFAPLHLQPPYQTTYRLPVTENLADRGLLLPCGPRLAPSDVDRVMDVLRSVA